LIELPNRYVQAVKKSKNNPKKKGTYCFNVNNVIETNEIVQIFGRIVGQIDAIVANDE
jgi:hypothetical protein